MLVCLVAVWQWIFNFPFPSPLIKPLLPPRLRWPTEQVEGWIESGAIDRHYGAFFARDPERVVPGGANMVSPSDGVLSATPVQDGTSYFVTSLSFWDVHVVRSPVEGVVTAVDSEGSIFPRNPGPEYLKEMVFLKDKAAPVQQIITIDSAYGPIKLRLITSYFASRLKVWVHPGQHVEKGERVGRILLGSNVVTEIPGDTHFTVTPGARLVGGQTIIYQRDTSP